MDDNARPHRSRAVTAYLQSEAVTSVLQNKHILFLNIITIGLDTNYNNLQGSSPHEPGFESHRAYLGHVRPSYTGSGTSCAKYSSVGSSIASGMAETITTGHPTSNWRDETQG
jgi:hypothetical protein